MYSSPRRALFVHNKSATGRSRGDSGGLGGWTGAKVEGHATRGRSNLPEGIRAEGAAHARADSGVLGGRNARAREVLRFSRGRNAPALRVCRRFLAEGPSLRYAGTVGMPLASKRKGERLDAHESPLLTDQRVGGASPDQLEDLVEQINPALRERGLPGLARDQQPGVIPGDPAPGEGPENPASD